MNEELKKMKNDQIKIEKYYKTLKYIYKKEIEKVDNDFYWKEIVEEIIKEKDIIKISNDIFQILLHSYIDLDNIVETKDNLFKSKNIIIKFLNKILSNPSVDNYLELSDTIMYFFERCSLYYLKDFADVETFVQEKEEKEEEEEEKTKRK